ncbi:MAG: hypothetical protein ACP5FH_00400 [Terracidiphilus sp.]
MHSSFDVSPHQILWTLAFAAQLVLLVVLLGRDRARRFPWFTAGIVLFALRMMAEVLLSGRMAMLPLQEVLLTMNDIAVIVSLMVVIEAAWQSFAGAGRLTWINGSMALLLVAVVAVLFWSPWPDWKSLVPETLLGRLQLMQLGVQKGNLLVNVLMVQLGLLVVLFGHRFKAGWRTHPQMIVIGLSTVAIVWLAIQGMWQNISRTAHPASRQEYQHLFHLGNLLMNVNDGVYLAASLWWIAWLWLEEPGRPVAGGESLAGNKR